jgi:alpha,alpha-trehalase
VSLSSFRFCSEQGLAAGNVPECVGFRQIFRVLVLNCRGDCAVRPKALATKGGLARPITFAAPKRCAALNPARKTANVTAPRSGLDASAALDQTQSDLAGEGRIMEYVDQSLNGLFVDLHTSGHWPDQKVISDAVLLAPAAEILAAYAAAKAKGAVDLKVFFAKWFRPVSGQQAYRTNQNHSPAEHIEAIWSHLTRPADDPQERSTRFPLPQPYVIAGGRFQEAYYWDSYFTQLGLLQAGQFDLVRAMLDNFAHAIATIGHIPNGFRSYFLTRSQPPFFAAMVQDYGRATGDLRGAYATYLPAMQAEYRYFTTSAHTIGGLARYWDTENTPRVEMYGTDLAAEGHTKAHPEYFRDLRAACESGWDFSSRWLTDTADLGTIRTTQLWALDLNCLLLRYEEILSQATGKTRYVTAANTRRAAIAKRFFDKDRGYFCDVVIADGTTVPVTTAAGMYALYAGAASPAQADRAVEWMRAHLLAPGGLLTTDVTSGQQWDAPNGWAPLQWIAIQGLRRYGFDALAETLRTRWLATCDTVFAASGKFVEKYNVLDPLAASGGGEYALQDGFGWTNGVYLDLLSDAPEPVADMPENHA